MEQSLDLYTRLVREGKVERRTKPRRRASEESLWPGYLVLLYLGLAVAGFVTGLATDHVWMIGAGFIAAAIPILFVVGLMWLTMIRRFSPNPVARIFFGAFTLALFGTGIGWFANLLLFLWVMDSKPDIITGEPLAHGPKRDAWLAQRRPQTNVSIDARQVHYHAHS